MSSAYYQDPDSVINHVIQLAQNADDLALSGSNVTNVMLSAALGRLGQAVSGKKEVLIARLLTYFGHQSGSDDGTCQNWFIKYTPFDQGKMPAKYDEGRTLSEGLGTLDNLFRNHYGYYPAGMVFIVCDKGTASGTEHHIANVYSENRRRIVSFSPWFTQRPESQQYQEYVDMS